MIVIGLYAGPGAGKSTLAAALFAALKDRGENVELVTEVAKDLTWEGSHRCLSYPPLVFGLQAWRIERLRGQVDVVVTDGPLPLQLAYASSYKNAPALEALLWDEAFRDTQLAVHVAREKPYSPAGRNQTELEARALDLVIEDILDEAFVQAAVRGKEFSVLPVNGRMDRRVSAVLAELDTLRGAGWL